jgi:glyoxylase-like metal-dependent hydrolase (beta-lactamase superfamily II)
MTKMNHHAGTTLSRRDALRLGLAGLGAASAVAWQADRSGLAAQFGAPAAPPDPQPNKNFPIMPTWETELKELAPNVYAYIQGGGPAKNNVSVSNAALVVGDEGILLFDALAVPIHAKNMVAAIRKVTDKPFKYLVTSHHHGDHIGGNQFIPGNPVIISHPYCRDEVVKQVPGPALWPKREGWAEGTEPRTILPATQTFDGNLTFHIAKTEVRIMPMLPAHTYGDLVMYLPEHKLLVAGDVGFFYVAPFCQNANPSNWIAICDQILGMDVERIVPGHGPLGGKQQLAEMADYLRLLRVEAKKRWDKKMTAGQAAADITLGKFDNWIGPERIIMDTDRFYMEFEGRLVPDMNVQGIRNATQEYNAIKANKKTVGTFNPYEEPYDERV